MKKKTQQWFQNLKHQLFPAVFSGIIFVLTVVGLGALFIYAANLPGFTYIDNDQELTHNEWMEAVNHLFWKSPSAGVIKYTGSIEVGGAVAIGGELQIGNKNTTCGSTTAGMLRYTNACLSYCNGSSWIAMSCDTYSWSVGARGACDKTCGGGKQTRTFSCKKSDGTTVADSNCSGTKPTPEQSSCNTQACETYSWSAGVRGVCDKTCGGGKQTRTFSCKKSDGTTVADSNCSGTKPTPEQSSCNTQACVTYSWSTGARGACDKTCGEGTQTRTVTCKGSDGTTGANSNCSGTKPSTSQSCNIRPCSNIVGGGCFIAGTKIHMADGSEKNIEDVKIGEQLRGSDGSINTVLDYYRPNLNGGSLYNINGQGYFVTNSHPFMTTEGWKSISPKATEKEMPGFSEQMAGVLEVGDSLVRQEETEKIFSIEKSIPIANLQLYNFVVDGTNTYYANGYLVHNKNDSVACMGDDSCH